MTEPDKVVAPTKPHPQGPTKRHCKQKSQKLPAAFRPDPAATALEQEAVLATLTGRYHTTRDCAFYPGAHKTYACIDDFLATSTLMGLITDTIIAPLSDYAPVHLLPQLPLNRVKIPLYRLRDNLLHVQANVTSLKKVIVPYLQTNDTGDTSLASVWEALKLVIRGELIEISAEDNRHGKVNRAALEKEVVDLETVHK
ncbi:hypothetical protein NDU88_006049 [Pleurodeles waltl]|uniref:Uncharacterized protein n=1 Tax=Pleurodeles waltl TaxID=8319 RepID=A0AAV7UKT1_PLEWA|nr:hypothetical protein NDU88_006049 [Pleurodeles waltl]